MGKEYNRIFKFNTAKYIAEFEINKLCFVIDCEAYNAYKTDGRYIIEFILKEPGSNEFDLTPFITTAEFPLFSERLILARSTAYFPKGTREFDVANIELKLLNEFRVKANISNVN